MTACGAGLLLHCRSLCWLTPPRRSPRRTPSPPPLGLGAADLPPAALPGLGRPHRAAASPGGSATACSSVDGLQRRPSPSPLTAPASSPSPLAVPDFVSAAVGRGSGRSAGVGASRALFGLVLRRLVYRSKQRGFLEVDLVLGTWVEQHIHSMDEANICALLQVLDLVRYKYLKTQICGSGLLVRNSHPRQ